MGNSDQAQATTDQRLLLHYRWLNWIKEEDSKWEQMIYIWRGLTLKQLLKEMNIISQTFDS